MPQIQIGKQPATQITIIETEPEKQAEALTIMAERARFMARQPGFISIGLHRSLDGRRIVNYMRRGRSSAAECELERQHGHKHHRRSDGAQHGESSDPAVAVGVTHGGPTPTPRHARIALRYIDAHEEVPRHWIVGELRAGTGALNRPDKLVERD